MGSPEKRARATIDDLLAAAGWVVQDRAASDLTAARGVAIREFPLTTGFADYLLFVDHRAAGAIEAKALGIPLSGIESQSAAYGAGLPPNVKAWLRPLPFLYESSGVETFFTNCLDPEARSRRVFAFHRPEALAEWLGAGRPGLLARPATLRGRLREMPPLITTGLWGAQIEAIGNLEASLAADRPRSLVQMATGSGKTYTAVSAVYRLIKHAGARRVLFLVDRSNLGRQTLKEFQQYVTPDDGRKFTELYNVQRLTSSTLDPVSRVCITTIQRLYSILAGEELDPEAEERSWFDMDAALNGPPVTVCYNPRIPIEYFDVVFTDECHRSIYNLWRQVLEYFDAYLVGLTATPSKQTLGFFNGNLVMEYPPVIRIPNITDGHLTFDDIKRATNPSELRPRDSLQLGDMVIVRPNGSRDLIGRAAVVESRLSEPYYFASYLIRFRLLNAGAVPTWIRAIWDAPSLRRQLEGIAATSAGQYNLSMGTLGKLPIPLPPTEEQTKIVSALGEMLPVAEATEASVNLSLARAERLRQAVLKRAFEGKLLQQSSAPWPPHPSLGQ